MSVPTVEIGYQTDSAWWGQVDDEKNPDLAWPKSISVYDRMRHDPQCLSVVRAVTLPILRAKWSVDGAGCKLAIAKHVAEDLGLDLRGKAARAPRRSRDRFSWPMHLQHAALELIYGHSFFEQLYRIDDRSGLAHIRKLGWRPPATITKINVASDGGLVSIEQGPLNPVTGPVQFNRSGNAEIPISRLVAYVNEREGANWVGRSLLRAAYKPWLLKDRMLRIQAQTNERNGLGVPVYTASEIPEGITGIEWERIRKEELAAGLEIARGFRSGENAGAAIPHGATLEMKGVTGTLPDTEKVIRYYDEQIARSVLAHFLNLGTQTGSWALGSTFADFFVLSLQTVAMQIADTVNQHIVEDLVDINWGPDEPAPRVVFEEIGSQHPATAEAIKALIDCGALRADEDLERHLRTMYGLPGPDASTTRRARRGAGDPTTPTPAAAPAAPPPDPTAEEAP